MISYNPLWNTLKAKGQSTYTLINKFGVPASKVHRLRHNLPITTTTLDDLCKILDCRVEDILEFEKDEKENG